MDKPRRNTDTSAATRSRRMTKWRRWASEMNASGFWDCKEIKGPETAKTEETN